MGSLGVSVGVTLNACVSMSSSTCHWVQRTTQIKKLRLSKWTERQTKWFHNNRRIHNAQIKVSRDEPEAPAFQSPSVTPLWPPGWGPGQTRIPL